MKDYMCYEYIHLYIHVHTCTCTHYYTNNYNQVPQQYKLLGYSQYLLPTEDDYVVPDIKDRSLRCGAEVVLTCTNKVYIN